MWRHGKAGFILPLSVCLVLLLGISGMSFMHLDWLERRVALTNVDNHGAFYLAQAGIARAQAVLKINTQSTTSWTTVLATMTNDANRVNNPLCPADPAWKCGVINNVGATVTSTSPNNLAFVNGLFDNGSYEVRVFNNHEGEAPNDDYDGILIVRARGTIRGEQKVLESSIRAVATTHLINCGTGQCPDANAVGAAPGREPKVGPLPQIDLTNSNNYYQNPTNLGFASSFPPPASGNLQSNTYYYQLGDYTLPQQTVPADHVVIFVTGNLTVSDGATLTNAILIGVTGVQLQGNGTIRAPLTMAGGTYPAVISAGNVTKSGGSATIYGNMYAQGTVDVNPANVHGTVFGAAVQVQGSSTYTDDHATDPDYIKKYYAPMPGFTYTPDMLTAVTVSGTWQEIQ